MTAKTDTHNQTWRGLPSGTRAGVRISANWSVLFTLALFTYLLASSTFPLAQPGESTFGYWLVGALTTAVFVITLLAHELAHAAMARHHGVRVRGITLWILGGITELDDEPQTPRADLLVAAAGPVTSLGLGVISGILAWFIGGTGLLTAALRWLAGLTVMFAVFNLLPGAPLDGGRMLRALLWRHYQDRARAAGAARQAGRVLGSILIALGCLATIAGALTGLWLALVGWFIEAGAAAERVAGQVDQIKGLPADDMAASTLSSMRLIVPSFHRSVGRQVTFGPTRRGSTPSGMRGTRRHPRGDLRR